MPETKSSYFEHIYDRYSALMYGCILNIVKNKHYADAVLQSVFTDIAALAPNVRAEMKDSSFWHIRYAMNKALSFLKEHNPAAYEQALKELVRPATNH